MSQAIPTTLIRPSAGQLASVRRRAILSCAIGAAFLMRPVGAVVLCAYGERMGRRAALVVTIGLMAVATGLTGLIPTYQSIGVWASILLVICRLAQGFSTAELRAWLGLHRGRLQWLDADGVCVLDAYPTAFTSPLARAG